jgi:hypothetical protein
MVLSLVQPFPNRNHGPTTSKYITALVADNKIGRVYGWLSIITARAADSGFRPQWKEAKNVHTKTEKTDSHLQRHLNLVWKG